MTLLEVTDSMVPSIQRFIGFLERTKAHERTLGDWFQETSARAAKLADKIDPPENEPTTSPRARLHAALIASGEGFKSLQGMEVSQRCLDWALAAYLRQEGEVQGLKKLAALTEDETWYFITERLLDSALNSLSQRLEREFLERFIPKKEEKS